MKKWRAASATSPHGGVLVVEDEAPNRALLVRLLTVEGYEVHTAVDGESALAAIERDSPDIILLDVGLPSTIRWTVESITP
jgi:CheY-like chemotaxis protein